MMNIQNCKITLNYVLWVATICAIVYLAFAIQQGSRGMRVELTETRSDMRALAVQLPNVAGKAGDQFAGRAIDAGNPLKNAKREINIGLKKAGVPFRL
jgi:hypothetical protein